MSETGLYRIWAERLNYGGSERLLRVLRKLATPEECSILLELPAPLELLAKRLKMDEETTTNRLQQLMQKGLVIPSSRHGFLTPTSILQLEDATMSSAEEFIDPELYDLWSELYDAEWGSSLADFFKGREKSHLRVIPAIKALQMSREISHTDILPYENAYEIVKEAKTVAVVNCPCRRIHNDSACGPREVCIMFNKGANYAIKRKAGKPLSVGAALALIDYVEECGFVHTVPNSTSVHNLMCNCCADCCVIIKPLIEHHILQTPGGLCKSRFQAVLNQQACTGCQSCVERCPFGAIEMERPSSSKRLKAVLNQEKCFGCGQCVLACEAQAITMKLVRPGEHIPQPTEEPLIPTSIPRKVQS